MSQDDMFQGDIDPEIAALLGTDAPAKPQALSNLSQKPDYGSLFEDEDSIETIDAPEVDLTTTAFPEITKLYESKPSASLTDPEYYKKALSGEGDSAQRVHTILQKYINAKDPKDRSVFRQQLILAFWEFLVSVAHKTPGKISEAKRILLRFGVLHPNLLSDDNRDLISKVILENDLGQPVFYLDEWFKAVGTGSIKNSMTDEVRVAKSNESAHLQQLLDKANGKRDGARNLLEGKSDERKTYETALLEKVQFISDHAPIQDYPRLQSGYTDVQRRAFNEIQELLKTMIQIDRDFTKYFQDFNQANEDVDVLQEKVNADGGGVSVNMQAIDTELETIKQMAKLTIGRQGNQFPILTREYFRSSPNELGTRENIIAQMAWIESIDPEAFCRSYKGKLNRIIPFVVLLPTYGDTGICWEPFDRFNRATSRGRIAIPMYPKNLPIAVLSAVADLRWQVAKEKASYYWMEEGLTGNYYQAFVAKKLKGDVKEYFIQEYITWMTKESDAIQRLDKDIRGIFWRYMPFSKEIKEKLKTRSYVYQELYQRDVNRTLSDGY